MTLYVKSMIADFPVALSGKERFPWNENLFKVDNYLKLTIHQSFWMQRNPNYSTHL